MLNKIKNYTMLVLFVLLLIAGGMWGHYQKKYKEEKIETARLDQVLKVTSDSVKLIKGENGLMATRLQALELTASEIKSYYSNIAADLRDMKIQLRKVSSVTAFNTETTNNINTFFRDSLIRDTIKIEKLTYRSEWLDLDIIKNGHDAQIKSVSRDSLIQVVHWDREGKFWPTKFMTRKIYFQDIKSMNPDSKIKYSKWIIPYKYSNKQ